MRVLHVVPSLAAATGGPAVATIGVASSLTTLGVSASIFATDLAHAAGARNAADRLDTVDVPCHGVDVRMFAAQTPQRLAYSRGLRRALAEEMPQVDLVHIHSLFLYPQFAAYRSAMRSGRPYVVSVRGALDPWLRGRGRMRKALANAVWQRRMLERAAAIHFTSEAEQELAAPVIPTGARQFVVPNGIDWSAFQQPADGDAFRRRYLAGHSGPIVMNLGRIAAKKGLDVLVRAFARVAREHPDAKLVFVGPDSEGLGSSLRALAAAEGVDHAFELVGLLMGGERLEALAAADVWALPSHTENFAIAVVEAMAAGKAVVVSPEVNIASDIASTRAGIVCASAPDALADELGLLLHDATARRELGRRGRAFAQTYDWSRVAPAMLGVYREVLTA